jgi:hypothetical protein
VTDIRSYNLGRAQLVYDLPERHRERSERRVSNEELGEIASAPFVRAGVRFQSARPLGRWGASIDDLVGKPEHLVALQGGFFDPTSEFPQGQLPLRGGLE